MTNRFADADSVEEVVFQAIGAGSTCWENMSGTGTFDSDEAKAVGDEAVARVNEIIYSPGPFDTWRCPSCWQRRLISEDCPECGSNGVGLYRHPPVDPVTGEVSAADNAISMGQMRHCDVPVKFRSPDCTELIDDHGWIDSDTIPGGITVCPPPVHPTTRYPAR